MRSKIHAHGGWVVAAKGTDSKGEDRDESRGPLNDAAEPGRQRVGSSSQRECGVAHAIEEVLLGVAVIAIATDDRIPATIGKEIVDRLLQANYDGRARELADAARNEVAALSDWVCDECQEGNPATFKVCWNCLRPQPQGIAQPSAKRGSFLKLNEWAYSAVRAMPRDARTRASRTIQVGCRVCSTSTR